MPQVKKVYILFGQKPRTNTEGEFYFHTDDTEKVWNLYLEKAGIGESVDVIPVSGSPAVFAAQMAFEDQFSGMNITPGFSPKEPSYGQRFTDIVNGLQKKLGEPKATLKFVPSNVNIENVSATKYFQIDQPIVESDVINVIINTEGVLSLVDLQFNSKIGTVQDREYSDFDFDMNKNKFKGLFVGPQGSIFELRYPNDDITGTAE